MTRLDDCLEPLHQGVWEVIVKKEGITEPLDNGWKRSAINVPSPGTRASYRKGRYHAHETETEWRVHLDRYDPGTSPLLHLVDDAPLILMIGDTFMTLITETRRAELKNTGDILKIQRFIWQQQVIIGLVLVLAGLHILKNPLTFFRNIFEVVIPVAIIGLAILVLAGDFLMKIPDRFRAMTIRQGAGILCAGILAYLLPLVLWVVLVLAVLALWMTASAVMLLRRVAKGRPAVPEGFYHRMAIGVLSLAAAVLVVVSPAGILAILVLIVGAVMLLLGLSICIGGLRLRSWTSGSALTLPAGYLSENPDDPCKGRF